MSIIFIRRGDVVEKYLSQQKLAEIIGASRQTVEMIESGNYNTTIKLCLTIYKELGKTLNDIFGEE